MENMRGEASSQHLKTCMFSQGGMKNKTHRKITKRILPEIDPKIVEEINRMMDKPEPWMPTISPKLGRIPWLSYRGHRTKGHDLLTVMCIGLVMGGLEGAAAGGFT